MSSEQHADLVVDWSRVIIDLNRAGISDQMIANEIGRSRTLIVGWRGENYADLKWHDGQRLIALWRTHMVPSLPMRHKYGPG